MTPPEFQFKGPDRSCVSPWESVQRRMLSIRRRASMDDLVIQTDLPSGMGASCSRRVIPESCQGAAYSASWGPTAPAKPRIEPDPGTGASHGRRIQPFRRVPYGGGLERQLHRIGALIEDTFYRTCQAAQPGLQPGISGRGDTKELALTLGAGWPRADAAMTSRSYSLGTKQPPRAGLYAAGRPGIAGDEPTNGMDPSGYGRGP